MREALQDAVAPLEPVHWWYRARRELLYDAVTRHVPRGVRLLDVGCGTGWVLQRLAGWCDVWGLERSPAAVAVCHARGLDRVWCAEVEALAGLDIPRVEAVTFFDVLEHLGDDVGALRMARAQLAPGGLVMVTVPAYPWLWSAHDEVHEHRRRYTRRTLRSALVAAGYNIELMINFNALLLPVAVVQRLAARGAGAPARDITSPQPWLNAVLERVLLAERVVLRRAPAQGFPAGLSILAVARPSE